MAKFRECSKCKHSCYDNLDEYYYCGLFSKEPVVDKDGNSGCYRSDKTLTKEERQLEK